MVTIKSKLKDVEQDFRLQMHEIYSPYIEKLGKYKPDYVGYRCFNNDGTSMLYCSSDAWYENPIDPEEEAMHYAKELLLINTEEFNFVVRSPSGINTPFLKELYLRDMCNSILFYKVEKKSVQMFAFIFSSTNLAAMNYFINCREVFENIAISCQEEIIALCSKPEFVSLKKPLFSEKMAKNIFSKVKKGDSYSVAGNLTARQKECLILLEKGATDKEIAKHLSICPKTVEYHLSNIKEKLQCHTRFDITQKIRNSII
jgi:DNA-binding CsgD family transcriptional regulator